MTDDLATLIRNVSEARGEDVSNFVRRAVLKELAMLNFLPPERVKALGIASEEETTA